MMAMEVGFRGLSADGGTAELACRMCVVVRGETKATEGEAASG